MKELKEIRFNSSEIILEDNLVKGSILPEKIAELKRNVIFKGNNVVEGPVFGYRIEVKQGGLDIEGSVFAQHELYINSDVTGRVEFKKCVASANSIVSRAADCELTFYSDINAKTVTLYNAFVAGSIYADEVELENCVVIGGVFATQEANLNNCIVGTFNAPIVSISSTTYLLLPSAFSIEKLIAAPNTRMFNLSLADLGSLFKGQPEAEESGKIEMSIDTDEVRSDLVDSETRKTLRSYTVVGKVLAADLIDTDKFQNHFLLTAASLGTQLLRTFDLGVGSDGKQKQLTIDNIRAFFFGILKGQIEVKEMNGTFDLSQIAGSQG